MHFVREPKSMRVGKHTKQSQDTVYVSLHMICVCFVCGVTPSVVGASLHVSIMCTGASNQRGSSSRAIIIIHGHATVFVFFRTQTREYYGVLCLYT